MVLNAPYYEVEPENLALEETNMLQFYRNFMTNNASKQKIPNIAVEDKATMKYDLHDRLRKNPPFHSAKTILVFQPGFDHLQTPNTESPYIGCKEEMDAYSTKYHYFYQMGYRIVFLLPDLQEYKDLKREYPLYVSHVFITEEGMNELQRHGYPHFWHNGKIYPKPFTAIMSSTDQTVESLVERSSNPSEEVQKLLDSIIKTRPFKFIM